MFIRFINNSETSQSIIHMFTLNLFKIIIMKVSSVVIHYHPVFYDLFIQLYILRIWTTGATN